METGKYDDYSWFTSDSSLRVLLERCPEIVLGRYVAVAAFDGGPLEPTSEEKKHGWSQDGRIAWSSKVLATDTLPRNGYDEWYVFPTPTLFKPREIFVNLGSFGLRDPIYLAENLDPTWDRVGVSVEIERRRNIQERFWSQLSSIRPESYVADGDELIFVTSNSELFAYAIASLNARI